MHSTFGWSRLSIKRLKTPCPFLVTLRQPLMQKFPVRTLFIVFVLSALTAFAQDPTGVLEGQVEDPSGALVPGAEVSAVNLQTGLEAGQASAKSGTFHFSYLPVGLYKLQVSAKGFAAFTVSSVRINVGRTINVLVKLQIAASSDQVMVTEVGVHVDLGSSLGNVVSSKEATDLPLNGRNFTQLGLLQPGVAPMTAGLSVASGILRSGQGYAVNGGRPESNNYLLDGATNVDSVNGGFALRTPVDAISEFRILTANSPAEYGETSGATTTVITKSGSNGFHGDLYEFLRNNAFDARNFFAAATEPLHQNQFGATLGGPIRKNRDFFFVYYEGQRDVQGETQAAIVPTAAQRSGDFSGIIDSTTGQTTPLINEFTGQPFPGNQIPSQFISPIAIQAEKLYPLGNVSPSLFSGTQIAQNNYDQGGFRLDHYFANSDQLFARFAISSLNTFDPLPINGSSVPGFPVTNSITTNSFTMSHVHLFSPQTVQTVRAAFFRNVFFYEDDQNHTPASSLGFTYQPTLSASAGAPYLIVSGYGSVGNPITGPQNTYQNDYQGSYSLAMTRGRHNFKIGADIDGNRSTPLWALPQMDSLCSLREGSSFR